MRGILLRCTTRQAGPGLRPTLLHCGVPVCAASSDHAASSQIPPRLALQANLSKFVDQLAQLRLLTSSGDSLAQLEELEVLLAGRAGQANLEALWDLWRRAVFSSQCNGHVLTPDLLVRLRCCACWEGARHEACRGCVRASRCAAAAGKAPHALHTMPCKPRVLPPMHCLQVGALHSLLKPYAAGAETLLELAGAHLSLALAGVVEPALQGLADLCEARGRAVAEQASLLAAAWCVVTSGRGVLGTWALYTLARMLPCFFISCAVWCGPALALTGAWGLCTASAHRGSGAPGH